jgi:glycosyltransferase involved in cell wall biosynthesis
VEIVVVDSGSTDGTVEISRRWCDRLIEIPAGSFAQGGALDLGAEAARAPFPDWTTVEPVFNQGAEHALANIRWGRLEPRLLLARRRPPPVSVRRGADELGRSQMGARGDGRRLGQRLRPCPLGRPLARMGTGGALIQYRRKWLETRGPAELAPVPPQRVRDALGEWWRPPDERHTALFHRLNYRRPVAIAGIYRGLAPTRRRGS